MMLDKYVTIKEVSLKNNCPECYSKNGLRLTFKQRFVDTKFYKSITAEIKYEINCTTCNTVIYPVQWTADIERVFEYQKRALVPKKTLVYIKKSSWVIIGAVLILAVITVAVLF